MDTKHLDHIERTNCVLGALVILVGALFFDAPVALGLALGAVLSCANFWMIHRLVLRVVKNRKPVAVGLVILKMLALFALVFLCIHYLPIQPVAFAIGLSVFLVSIAAESVRFALKVENGRA